MKSIAILCDKGPFGTNLTIEATRLGAGFMVLGEEIDCCLILSGEGVLFLKKGIESGPIQMDSVEEGIEMADLSGLPIKLIKEDLEEYGIEEKALQDYEELEIITRAQLPEVLANYEMWFKM